MVFDVMAVMFGIAANKIIVYSKSTRSLDSGSHPSEKTHSNNKVVLIYD